MTRFSKGPWKMRFKRYWDWSILSADGYFIAGIPYDADWGRPKEDAANAQLIALAPAMYKELRRIQEILKGDGGEIHALHGILKAKRIEKLLRKVKK